MGRLLKLLLCLLVGLWFYSFASSYLQKRQYDSYKRDLAGEVSALVAVMSNADVQKLNQEINQSVHQMTKIEKDYASSKAANATPKVLTALATQYRDSIMAASKAVNALSQRLNPETDKINATLASMAKNATEQLSADSEGVNTLLAPVNELLEPAHKASRAKDLVTSEAVRLRAGETETQESQEQYLKACQDVLEEKAHKLNQLHT